MQDYLEPIDIQPTATRNRRIFLAVVSVLLVVILAVVAALLVKHYVVTPFIVDGTSMYPTLDGGDGPNIEYWTNEAERKAVLENGETLYLNKVAKIKRGDIVVFNPKGWSGATSERYLVKRVIGVAGDRVQIINGNLYLNSRLIEEPYINEPMNHAFDGLDVTVGEGCIFCLGDNRNYSDDSRAEGHGDVKLEWVVGKCFLIRGINGKFRIYKTQSI